jgi:antibiotic biosynthesis monooxygenase (ABM) superfamily enzyme
MARAIAQEPAMAPERRPPLIERHITFNVLPDKTADFERFILGEYRSAMAKSQGFVKCELLREADSLTRYQLVFRFESSEGAVGWRTSEVHVALQPTLEALRIDMAIQGYEFIG